MASTALQSAQLIQAALGLGVGIPPPTSIHSIAQHSMLHEPTMRTDFSNLFHNSSGSSAFAQGTSNFIFTLTPSNF